MIFCDHSFLIELKVDDFCEQDLYVVAAPQNRTNGSGDLAGRESGGRDLVEQRLKSMMIPAVDEDDLNVRRGESARSGQSSEASAHDYNAGYWTVGGWVWSH
jgi:hypothetical protein